ncbi:expressed unknown protein [Seminavis robusta]|uniref:Uncharacterized protein n=1 Tax=Seminavis robusta TaxID=568900 RepID=A0A9N8H4S9_9STRA|nr:expressed unknown protein [Seminavis robusta]|eukprot:Sro93_g048430.1 n/a (293) ;mRNA; r:42291-43169
MENDSATPTLTRVPNGQTVAPGQIVVGNPVSPTLTKAEKAETDNDDESMSWHVAGLLRNTFLLLHLGYLFVGAVLTLEIVRDVDLGDLEIEYTLPIRVGLVYLLIVAGVVLELHLVKRLVFGKTVIEKFSLRTFRGVTFHHMQVIVELVELVTMPLIGGLFPLTLHYKLLGANIGDCTSVFIDMFGFVDPGDAENTTIGNFAVVDEASHCVAHRVDRGTLNHGTVYLGAGAVLHPGAVLMLGSMGAGSQLLPLSKTLREQTIEDHELLIGLPAVHAQKFTGSGDHNDAALLA